MHPRVPRPRAAPEPVEEKTPDVATAFPNDYLAGHFVMVGGTGTGKSYYAKYIVKELSMRKPNLQVFVFVAPISAHDWLASEQDGSVLVPPDNVYQEWPPGILQLLNEKLRETKCGLVIFDDFKSQVDYHTNKDFKELFRVLRHLGTQIFAISHTPNDVPPVARDGVTHAIFTYSSNRNTITELARNYLGGDVGRLAAVLKEASDYAVVKINKTQNSIRLHRAGGVSTSALGCAVAGGGDDLAAPGGAELQIGQSLRQGASVSQVGRGNVRVNGTYNDASVTNQYLKLQENLVAQQRMNAVALQDMRARARLNQDLEIEREEHAQRLRQIRENAEALDLLHKPAPSAEEQARLAEILAKRLGDAGITPHNFRARGADVEFMQLHYPGVPYRPPAAALQECALVVPRLVRGEYGSLVGDLAQAATSQPDAKSGLVGFAAGLARSLRGALVPVVAPATLAAPASAPPAPPSQAVNEARRGELRRLTLLQTSRRATAQDHARLIGLLRVVYTAGPVTSANYLKVALMFLREYYPADFEALKGRPPARQERQERRERREHGRPNSEVPA